MKPGRCLCEENGAKSRNAKPTHGDFVQEELTEPGQTMRGVVIALEDDQRLRRALAMVPAVEFYRYEISFRLVKS